MVLKYIGVVHSVNFVPSAVEDGECIFINYYDFPHDIHKYISICTVNCLKLWGLLSTFMGGFTTPCQSALPFDMTFQCMSSASITLGKYVTTCWKQRCFPLSDLYRVE